MALECDTLDNNEIVASIKFTVYTTKGKCPAMFWFAHISSFKEHQNHLEGLVNQIDPQPPLPPKDFLIQ